jgi:pseudaminic acid cytidylyltransferase
LGVILSRNLAIIPVRAGSKRLLKKNLREFYGKPLFTYSINCALESELFDEIHVSTESDEVAAICVEYGITPEFMRPNCLATDTATLNEVCKFVIREYELRNKHFDKFCILWATAPLRTEKDISNGFKLLTDDTDAVVGVTNYDLPVFCAQQIGDNNNLTPIFPDMVNLSSRQFPKTVCDNGSFCWVKIDAYKKYGTWLPPRLSGYEMPRERSCDIDTEEDWKHALYLYEQFLKQGI